MTLHTKPTKEELQAGAEKALAEAEALATQEPEVEPEKVEEVVEEPVVEQEVVADPEETLELKKKLTNSAKEAQVLQSRTKKYDEAVGEAEAIVAPTDADMEAEYGTADWNEMTMTEQRLAKKSWLSEKRFEIMSKVSKEGRDIEKWNASVDTFVDDPKVLIDHPELEGKTEDFKLFAMKPSRRGLDMQDLILAFNGDLAINAKPKNKGKMFESGVAGNKEKPQPGADKLSPSQSRVLMNTDYKKWKEMLKQGKISNE